MERRWLHRGFWWKTEGKDHLQDVGVDGRIICEKFLHRQDGRTCTGFVAQDRDKRWAVVNSVTNFWIPQNAGNFLVT